MSDDEVKRLPVRFKTPPKGDNPFLVIQRGPICGDSYYSHAGPFLVDDTLDEVECGTCKAKLNPMWVLRKMANNETKWHHTRDAYNEEMKRLSERSRTKCQHCGKLTRISGRATR